MSENHVCPRCRLPVASERLAMVPAICDSCGYVLTDRNAVIARNLDRSNSRAIVACSAVALVLFFNLAGWGTHALEMRWLQFKDVTGLASVKNFERMATICADLKKTACVEHAYKRQAQVDSRRSVELAEFLMSRKKFSEAARALDKYMTKTKPDAKAMLVYARALGEAGRIDEAARYYESLIAAKARVLQPDVVKNYVTHLARAKRYERAQDVIWRMRRKHARAANFMDSELRILHEIGRGPDRLPATASRTQ